MFVYLAGAIEYSPDLGKGWRQELSPFLEEILGHRVYDPALDERKSLTEEEQQNLRQWKTTDLARFQVAIRKIIEFDLAKVAQSDYVVCFWDEYAQRGGGTSSELTHALGCGVPVYMVTSLEQSRISGWILGCCDRVFTDFEGLKKFLLQRYSAAQLKADC